MVGELAAKHGGTTAKAERTKEYKFRAMPYSTAVYSLPIEVHVESATEWRGRRFFT